MSASKCQSAFFHDIKTFIITFKSGIRVFSPKILPASLMKLSQQASSLYFSLVTITVSYQTKMWERAWVSMESAQTNISSWIPEYNNQADAAAA